jgi:hypothetical protein
MADHGEDGCDILLMPTDLEIQNPRDFFTPPEYIVFRSPAGCAYDFLPQ